MGSSLIALGRCREAAAILREGSKLDGSGLRDRTAHENAKISALLQLANLYADQEKLQRAIAIYREALHVLPERYPPQVRYKFGFSNKFADFQKKIKIMSNILTE
jgi:protein O-mannosyl-transferase